MTQSSLTKLFAILLLVFLQSPMLFAQGKPKGGGGTRSAYTTIDLPGPYHAANGGSSQTAALQIADVAGMGPVYVLGGYGSSFNQPCVWTVSSNGSTVATDLAGQINVANDINSGGIIAGQLGNRPVLLLTNGTPVFLGDASVSGSVRGLNNPDANGVFQAVGYVSTPALTGMIWDVAVDGSILSEIELEDTNGSMLLADDVSDSLLLGGHVRSTPAVGAFDFDGQLQIDWLPIPPGIDGVWDKQVDDGGNVLGFGYQWGENFGYYARAAIWPSDGGAINLTALTGVADTEGNGIALVNGTMHVVGRAHNIRGDAFAYLYSNGSLSDLGPLSQGDQSWTLQRAEGVNSSGMICGQGRVGTKRNVQIHGFLLRPNTP
jgi:probable HAF family extracellular repeat protein